MSTPAVIFLIPVLLALCGLLPRTARWLPAVAAVLMLAQVAVAAWACVPGLMGGAEIVPGRDFGLDGLGAAFVILTTVVAAASSFQAALLFPAERGGAHGVSNSRLTLYYTLTSLFLLAMYGVLLAWNLGYLWIAMEATTLMSAPLVYFHRSQPSLEATWKYLLLCSVGIAFALFGTVLIFASSQPPTGEGGTLALGGLLMRGPTLDPRLLRLGFIFCLLGYGTKAGIFPLHNWLPDAHSEAPAPASAMLSGALLNCALVALWRISQVVVAAGHAELVRHTLVPAAAITVLAAGLMLVRQHDLKRMWAYSSVEHVGLLSLAIAIGSGPVFVLHAINHSLVKTALFLLAGNVLHLFGTKSLAKLHGLLRAAPAWGLLLGAAGFAVAGSPPFGTFLSEWLLLRDTLAAGETIAAALVLVGLTVTFLAVASHVGRVLFGAPPKLAVRPPPASWALMPAVLLALSLLAGLAVGPPIMGALRAWTRQSALPSGRAGLASIGGRSFLTLGCAALEEAPGVFIQIRTVSAPSSPVGTAERSPALQRWEGSGTNNPVPEGRPNIGNPRRGDRSPDSDVRPSLRDWIVCTATFPALKRWARFGRPYGTGWCERHRFWEGEAPAEPIYNIPDVCHSRHRLGGSLALPTSTALGLSASPPDLDECARDISGGAS